VEGMLPSRRIPLAVAALMCACGSAHSASMVTPDASSTSMPTVDAALDLNPSPPSWSAEAGFIDLPPQPTSARYPARMFYDFQPADVEPTAKPLFVFFNGGPGDPTSSILLVRGTGRTTLIPDPDGGIAPVANPASWTRFGNLLYLDERLAGFSYGLQPAAGCVMSAVEDASDFVRALLDFLDHHPTIASNQIVLVGESYGGVRASWMLDLLLRYSTEAAKGGADLPALIQRHLDAVFPTRAGTIFDESTVALQFGWQVLIEPEVLGEAQTYAALTMFPSDPYLGPLDFCSVDQFIATKPPQWTGGLDVQAIRAMGDPTAASALLGVDLRSIAELAPDARADGFHSPAPEPQPLPPDAYTPPPPMVDGGEPGACPGPAPPDPTRAALVAANASLTSALGQLNPADSYYTWPGQQCRWAAYDFDESGAPFVANLRHVRTLITHARWDFVVYAPAIPAVLQQQGFPVTIDSNPRPGIARPGWFDVTLQPTSNDPVVTIEVRFPLYDQAGHEVTVMQPMDFADDVRAWLAGQ
jgi:Serine carboxypeptidase